MRKIVLIFSAFAAIIVLAASCGRSSEDGWHLVWSEEFDSDGAIDTEVWSKIPRGKSDWNNYMSDYDALYEVKDGNLILRGIVNDAVPSDTASYLTGGLYTKGKKAFEGGRLAIRAKMQGATGEWPAFWMLSEAGIEWPVGGEIDIVERLNHDTFVYQTVHSHYTHTLGFENDPPHFGTNDIDPDDYNVYSVDMYPDSLVFAVNGRHTFTYPRIETEYEGQYPFCQPYFLMVDMQLGGSWVGGVDPQELPAEVWVDWVRYYLKDD